MPEAEVLVIPCRRLRSVSLSLHTTLAATHRSGVSQAAGFLEMAGGGWRAKGRVKQGGENRVVSVAWRGRAMSVTITVRC